MYRALNRANARLTIFDRDEDYAAFERVLAQAVSRYEMRLLVYCLMPSHFHVMLLRWLTVTHTQRWYAHHGTAGTGHVDQVSLSHSRCSRTSISSAYVVASSGMHFRRTWLSPPTIGSGVASGRGPHRTMGTGRR